jgi:hypothetical protein
MTNPFHIHAFTWPVKKNITLHFAKPNAKFVDKAAVFVGSLMECSCRQLKFFPQGEGLNPVEVERDEIVGGE